jgi:hypothetical protein
MSGDDLIFTIWARCGRAIDAIQDALAANLTTSDDDADDPTAREQLTRAMAATKLLRAHIETTYDLLNGGAELKEGVCRE